jgi:hypothetical protein
MSESAILKWMETLNRGQERIEAEVVRLRESLATCQAKHAGERTISLRRKGALTKILAGAIVAAVSALAGKYLGGN